MTETFQNTAEGGTNTTAVTTLNSGGASGDAFTAVSGAPTFTTVSPLDGAVSYLFSATATQFLNWDAVAAWSDFAYYGYLSIPANPITSGHMVLGWRSLSAALGNVIITTSGELTANAGTGGSATSSPTAVMTAGVRYRFEGQCTGWGTASSTHALQLYLGAATTPLSSVTATGTTAGGVQRLRGGRPNGTTTLATGLMLDTLKVVFGDATVITPISTGGRPHIFRHPVGDLPRRLFTARRARITEIANVLALGAFSADVAGTTSVSSSTTAVVGDVGSVTGSTTASGNVAGVVGLAGSVTGSTTTAGTVSGAVARFGAVTGSTAGSGTVNGQVGVIGSVSGATTGTGTVTGLVARSSAVTGTTTAGGTVIASTVSGLLADVTGSTTAAGTITPALTATSGTSGTTTTSGTVTGLVNAVGTVTGSTTASGTVTPAPISGTAGTTAAGGQVDGQVAAASTVSGTTTATSSVTGVVGVRSGVTGSTAVGGTIVRQLGTALVVTGTTIGGGTVTGQVAAFAQVAGTTTVTGEITVGSATVGRIYQGSRPVGGPRQGRKAVGGPRPMIRRDVTP